MGPRYDRGAFLRARDVARELTFELSSRIVPGMREQDAHEVYKLLLPKYGVEKQWHPPKLRFGPNTRKSFRELSDDYVLADRDIFFIDIGPVIEDHEADFGETFVLGADFEHKLLAEASKSIFKEVEEFWRKTRATGVVLYGFAEERSRARGLKLNLSSSGHRIGDFPHQLHYKGKLLDVDEVLIPDAWVLEVHVENPAVNAGAFFEDVLLTS